MIFGGKLKARGPKVFNQDDYNRGRWIDNQFKYHRDYWQPDIDRAIENARMYWFVNFGQWPESVIEKFKQEGKRPPTFPIIPDKIETLIGSILSNDFDIKYSPQNGKIDTVTLKLQSTYVSDKMRMNWETSEIPALLDALIMCGYERMIISDKVDDFGNIAWERLDPRHVYLDPEWVSNDVNDIFDYFVDTHMTARKMMKIYNKASERLQDLMQREKREGVDYGVFPGAAPRYSHDEKWTTALHKVIEYHHVEEIEEWYEWDLKNSCWFPDTGFKNQSENDIKAKIEYLTMMELNPASDITKMKRKKRIKYIEARCPDIDLEIFLTRGKDTIQTNNCNIYPLGLRYNGSFQGMVDRLKDIQTYLNKDESIIQDLQITASKGTHILDGRLAGGNEELKDEIIQKAAIPGSKIWVDEGATEGLPNAGITMLQTAQPTPDMFRQADRYIEYADRFSKVPAAQDARSESAQESGRLFNFKLQVGQIGQKFLMHFVQQHKKAKAEAYPLQAKITYAGVPREFPSMQRGIGPTRINMRLVNQMTGKIIVLDDFSKLPMMMVTVSPAKSSFNVRMDLKIQYSEMLGIFAPEDRLLRLVAQGKLLELADGDEEQKEEIMRALQLTKVDAALQMMVRIKQSQLQLLQAEMMLMQAQGGMGGGMMPPQEMPQIGQQSGQPDSRNEHNQWNQQLESQHQTAPQEAMALGG
jgi:hypothetical protein